MYKKTIFVMLLGIPSLAFSMDKQERGAQEKLLREISRVESNSLVGTLEYVFDMHNSSRGELEFTYNSLSQHSSEIEQVLNNLRSMGTTEKNEETRKRLEKIQQANIFYQNKIMTWIEEATAKELAEAEKKLWHDIEQVKKDELTSILSFVDMQDADQKDFEDTYRSLLAQNSQIEHLLKKLHHLPITEKIKEACEGLKKQKENNMKWQEKIAGLK